MRWLVEPHTQFRTNSSQSYVSDKKLFLSKIKNLDNETYDYNVNEPLNIPM